METEGSSVPYLEIINFISTRTYDSCGRLLVKSMSVGLTVVSAFTYRYLLHSQHVVENDAIKISNSNTADRDTTDYAFDEN